MTQQPTEGAIVLYVLNEGPAAGEIRPAIIVRCFRNQDGVPVPAVQLQVFTDTDNTGRYNDQLPQVMWKSSVDYSEEKTRGTWHWPEATA